MYDPQCYDTTSVICIVYDPQYDTTCVICIVLPGLITDQSLSGQLNILVVCRRWRKRYVGVGLSEQVGLTIKYLVPIH